MKNMRFIFSDISVTAVAAHSTTRPELYWYESTKNMFYAYNVLTVLVDLGVEVDTYQKRYKTKILVIAPKL